MADHFSRAKVAVILLLLVLSTVAEGQLDQRRERVDRLIQQLASPDWRARLSSVVGLSNAGPDARHALPSLYRAQSDEHPDVRRWARKAVRQVHNSLQTADSIERVVDSIAGETPPPKWRRVPAFLHQGENLAKGVEQGGLVFVDSRLDAQAGNGLGGGVLLIRIPLPYAKHAHARFIGRRVELGPAATLRVKLTNGYVPAIGEEREIVASRTLVGKFGRTQFPPLPQDRRWRLIYDRLEDGVDLDRDGRADITLRVEPVLSEP